MIYISLLVQHHGGPTADVLLGKNENGIWEFPNGHVMTGETEEEACERIAWEVLGIKVNVIKRALIGAKYPSNGVTEHILQRNITHNNRPKDVWHCYYEVYNKWQNEPVSDKYTEFKWVHPSELGKEEFEGDDKNFMAKYDPYVNPKFIPDVRML